MNRIHRNSKRHIAAALGILLLAQPSLSVLAETSYATYEEYRAGSVTEGRNGTVESEYTVIEIETEADLWALAEQCRLDTWSADKFVKLNADITLQEETDICIPIFGGIFEGNGHTISNLQITCQGSGTGLFRYLQEGGIIRNLNVQGQVTPEGTQDQVGGIVGRNYGTIYSCSFSGHVNGDGEVGGIAGVNESTGEIRKCHSSAIVTGNHSVGGITGNNHGVLNNCSNAGSINAYSKEVTFDLEDITLENIEDLNSTDNVTAHTDSGGVAGISDGKIYYCTNSGTVGYSHVGYNTGGIVGRLHQGYLQNCTNTGHVLGRKDVGGIVGQMEPFLEIQYLNGKLQELDQETDRFLDLLDATHQDLNSYGEQASSLAKNLTANLKNVSSAAGRLSGTANDLWYIYNNELTGINQNLKTLNQEWSDQSNADKENGNSHDVTVSGGDAIKDLIKDNADEDLDEDFGDKISDGWNDLIDDIRGDKESDKKDDTSVDGEEPDKSVTIKVPNDTESYLTALRKFGDNATVHIDHITTATTDRSGGITDNLNIINKEMESAGNHLERLTDVLEAGTDKTGDNMDALVEQAKVLRRLISEIRDDLFSYEGITVRDTSDEAASKDIPNPGAEQDTDEYDEGYTEEYYDTTSFQLGKVTLCVNKGLVEADTNVGGIVGQIATEYDFDPEDDIALTGAESFDIEKTIKAVVRDSRNLGEIISRKDCVGGIVGKAEFGAIISCESYGDVSSTSGSNVGGIAGVSDYAIRSCYTMGELSGKNYVGGIAGKGCDIFYSYAYNTLELTGEGAGAIAGSLQEDGTLCGNYYVEGNPGGIDGIGYSGGATPLTYEEFRSLEGVPEAFFAFTVTFMADGEELASYQCAYGDSLSEEQIPAIPKKEGVYGVWPEFDFDNITGNRVLEAVYEPWVNSLAGAEKDESGRAKVLVEGEFLPDQELLLTQEGDEISFTVKDSNETPNVYRGPVVVHVLCEDNKKAKVEIKTADGFTETEITVTGSYILFHMDEPGTFRVTYAKNNSIIIWCVVAGVVVVLAAAVILLTVKKRLSAKKAQKKEDAKNVQKAVKFTEADAEEISEAKTSEDKEH